MSLLNELDPRVRELLDAEKEQYPNTTRAMIENMQSAYVIGDLTVNTATNLINYAEKAKVEFDTNSFILKLYQIFGR